MAKDLTDPKTVKKDAQNEKDVRKQELNDIRTLLSNASGRRFMWRVLEKCSAFSSVFDPDPKTMSYYSGRQDLGHFLMAEITEADENLLLKLMRDNYKKRREEAV